MKYDVFDADDGRLLDVFYTNGIPVKGDLIQTKIGWRKVASSDINKGFLYTEAIYSEKDKN